MKFYLTPNRAGEYTDECLRMVAEDEVLFIPKDEGNRHYQMYLAWCAEGNAAYEEGKEPVIEEAPAAEPVAEETPVEEAPASEPAPEAPIEEPVSEEPVVEQPVVEGGE